MYRTFLVFFLISAQQILADENIDCSEAYGERAQCVRVQCSDEYRTYIGTWKGPFVEAVENPNAFDPTDEKEQEWSEKIPFYAEVKALWPRIAFYNYLTRPYHNEITYSESDCLQNIDNGDKFIVGRQQDHYPEFQSLPSKVETGLLITGRQEDGTPFLRTIKNSQRIDYELVRKVPEKTLSIWKKDFPWGMTITIVDGRDAQVSDAHKRNVTLLLEIGDFKGPIAYGHHTLQD